MCVEELLALTFSFADIFCFTCHYKQCSQGLDIMSVWVALGCKP